jgi:hypothetical protein
MSIVLPLFVHAHIFQALDGLTNNENKLSSFYMRALFWMFPSILSVGKKGKMIRRVKAELGAIACKMWQDAKSAIDARSNDDDKTLMALMCKLCRSIVNLCSPRNSESRCCLRPKIARGRGRGADEDDSFCGCKFPSLTLLTCANIFRSMRRFQPLLR